MSTCGWCRAPGQPDSRAIPSPALFSSSPCPCGKWSPKASSCSPLLSSLLSQQLPNPSCSLCPGSRSSPVQGHALQGVLEGLGARPQKGIGMRMTSCMPWEVLSPPRVRCPSSCPRAPQRGGVMLATLCPQHRRGCPRVGQPASQRDSPPPSREPVPRLFSLTGSFEPALSNPLPPPAASGPAGAAAAG